MSLLKKGCVLIEHVVFEVFSNGIFFFFFSYNKTVGG